MQSRNNSQSGLWTTTNFNNGNTSVETRLKSIDELFVLDPGSTSVDRKTPNPHAWTHKKDVRMNGTVRTIENASGKLLIERRGTNGSSCASCPTIRDVSDYVHNQSIGDLYDQLRGGVDLSVDIAQRGQTATMVRGAADLVNYVRSFRKGDLKGAYDLWIKRTDWRFKTKTAGSKWLEFQYGWKPTAQTMYGCLQRIQSDLPRIMKITGNGRNVTTKSGKFPSNFGSNHLETGNWNVSERCRTCCTYRIGNSTAQKISNYTSLNPVSLAWEALPFSFVVDWVYDIGGYLRMLETALVSDSAFSTGYVTKTFKLDGRAEVTSNFNNGSNQTESVAMEGSFKFTKKIRSVGGGSPLPRPPAFHADLGSGRLLNAAALLTQLLK